MNEDKWVELYMKIKNTVRGNTVDDVVNLFAANIADVSIDCNIPIMELLARLNVVAVDCYQHVMEEDDGSTKH